MEKSNSMDVQAPEPNIASLVKLARAHAFVLVPGTPEWDLIWELVSAFAQDKKEQCQENDGSWYRDVTEKDKLSLATAEKLEQRMDAFAGALAES